MNRRVVRALTACVPLSTFACGGHAVRDVADASVTTSDAPGPEQLPAAAPVRLVVGVPTLALFADGSVWAWWPSWTDDGVLLHGPPRRLTELQGADDITQHCVLRTGHVDCWGYVGDETDWSLTPLVRLEDQTRVRRIAEGDSNVNVFVHALREDGSVWCSPLRIAPTFNAAPTIDVPPALQLGDLGASAAIAAGLDIVCGVDSSGTPACARLYRYLPDDPTSIFPIDAPGSDVALDSGSNGVCFIGSNPVTCRASDQVPAFEVVLRAPSTDDAVRSASIGGNANGCALTESGRIYRTSLHDEAGDAGATIDVGMQPLNGVPRASLAVAGSFESCAAVSDGVYCWAHEGFDAWNPKRIR